MMSRLILCIFFSLIYVFAYSQNPTIKVNQFKDCNDVFINLDSIKNSLSPSPLSITIIVFRAESYPTNSKITSLYTTITSNCPLVNIISYELESTDGVNFCYFNVISGGKVEKVKVTPSKFWVTTSDATLLNSLKNDLYLNEAYKTDASLLTKEYEPRNYYAEINKVIENYCKLCLNKYIDFFLINKQEIQQIKNSLTSVNSKIDSLFTDTKARAQNKIISLLFSYNIPFLSLTGSDNYDIKRKNGYSVVFDYTHYINNWFGYGCEVNYNKMNLELYEKNITDTLFDLTDNYGDKYNKIIYAKDIQERVTIQTGSIIPHFSFKYSHNKKWILSLNPGIKFSSVLVSSYKARSGTVSYGALYPQYSNDTIFSGMYDFYQNQPVYSNEQNLAINKNSVSLFLPVIFQYYIPATNFTVNIGGYYEHGLTNILNAGVNEKIISYKPNNYNSLLYRYDNIKINSLAFRFGVSYSF